MPTENRSSTEMISVPRELAEEIISALYDHDLNGLTVRLQELLDRPEQHQGEPVLLPMRRSWSGIAGWRDQAEIKAWNACLDEIAKLGPLYTHPAPAVQKGEPVAVPVAWMRFDADQRALFTRTKRSNDSQPLYDHPTAYRTLTGSTLDAGEVERLRAEVKRLDLLVAQADYNYDEDRASFRRQLAERDDLLGSAKSALCHLLHNIKISGKRIDLGLAKDSADTVITLINALQAEAKS